jgi:hypothetical protein
MEAQVENIKHNRSTLVLPNKMIGLLIPVPIVERSRLLIIGCDRLDRETEIFECDEPQDFFDLSGERQETLLQAACIMENRQKRLDTDDPCSLSYHKDRNNFVNYLVQHVALLVSDYPGSQDQYANLSLRDVA